MALVIKKLIDLHFYFNDECSDPRVKDWFLMKDPLQGLCILAVYLYFVLNLGPKLMANRKPFKLDGIMKIYNILQVLVCGWLVYDALKHRVFSVYNMLCESVDYSYSELGLLAAKRSHLYFLIKMVDLLDTVFFVLRKKQNQVSFLHVYHHTGMVMLSWAACKYFPGGHGVFTGLLNCFVHVIMYFYYFLTSMNESYKKSIWWKKHITQLQIAQFGLIALHWMILFFKPWLVPECQFPRWPLFIMWPQNLFMFLLFLDFYKKSYLKPTTKKASQ